MKHSNNRLLNVDSYKLSQPHQYPPKTTFVMSYIESRGGLYKELIFNGLQPWVMDMFTKPITVEEVDQLEAVAIAHGDPFYREGWDYILNELGGILPVTIEAVREGRKVPVSNVLVTIQNEDPKCWWLTSFLETSMLRTVWYPTTVSTISYEIKKIIMHYLNKNGTPELQPFKHHDFGARGVSGSAGQGGAAHLIHGLGSDTIEASGFIYDYYGGEYGHSFSIPASEHSTITSWTREHEFDAFENMIDQFAGEGKIFACVSDSYDIFEAIKMWKKLEQKLLDKGGTLVIRPDSGDPVEVPVEVVKRCLKEFGYTMNSKGYKVLPDHIRVIQGDGVNPKSIQAILGRLDHYKISADNIAFGMGGALLQKCDRDTLKFAMKCCAARVDGDFVPVFKQPITDSGKDSKKGVLDLITGEDGQLMTIDRSEVFTMTETELHTIVKNGEIVKLWNWNEVKEAINI